METGPAFTNSPNHSSQESSSPAAIIFCSLCNKPFTNESSRSRHSRYCASRTRSRPRSCHACSAAKKKCNFETPCSLCVKKNLECVYDGASKVGRRALLTSSQTNAGPWSMSSASPVHEFFPEEEEILSYANTTFANPPAMDDADYQQLVNGNSSSLGLSTQTFSLNESLNFNELLAFEDYSSGQLHNVSDFAVDAPSWCSWTRRGFSLEIVTETSLATHSRAAQNVDLVIQALRSFPTMMLRRETFPWFIHPQSHLLAKPARTTLPEALSNCMGMAQMFALRTRETQYFLWRHIRAEYRRFSNEKQNMSKSEILAALQASIIYLIMCIIDQCPESEETSLGLLISLHDLYAVVKQKTLDFNTQSELSAPSSTWESWIFAESQRRFANLWFLVGVVVCVKKGIVCDLSQSYRYIPLPSLKCLWEAPTQSAWELEYEANRILQTSGLVTLGDLIDAQKSRHLPANAQKLDIWNAGVDNLGFLLNLVGTMV